MLPEEIVSLPSVSFEEYYSSLLGVKFWILNTSIFNCYLDESCRIFEHIQYLHVTRML